MMLVDKNLHQFLLENLKDLDACRNIHRHVEEVKEMKDDECHLI
jgi:hypothetical protein